MHKTRTTLYRPSGNGQVERYNRTLMDAVRCYIDGCPKSWDQYLGPLAGALRSAINRHTGYTANKLMLGREVNVPATILYRPPDSNDFQNGEEGEVDRYVRNLQEDLQRSHEIARERLKAAQKTMKRDYDIRAREHQFKVGDAVYWRRNAGKKVESMVSLWKQNPTQFLL